MRTHSVGRHVAPEMLALWIIEVILTFALSLILMTPATASVTTAEVHPAMVCALTVGFTAFIIGIYRPQIFSKVHTLFKTTLLASLLSFPAVWIVCKVVGVSSYLPIGYDSLRPLKIVALWSTGLLATRMIFMIATRCGLFVHRVAVIGVETSPNIAATIRAGRKGFLEIQAVDPETSSATFLRAAKIRTLVISSGASAQSGNLVNSYIKQGLTVQSEADFWENCLRRVDITSLGEITIDASHHRKGLRTKLIFGRSLDIVLSLGLLISTLPIICVMAVLVRIDSAGPVFYRQERVGLDGAIFTLFKFRSMRSDAEAGGPRWAQMRDPRVTRLGSFMRKTRIDELPQLLNILRGEMSFIGPRPERPHFVEQLETVIPCYRARCQVKPGLTGWAQVNYPYGASVEDARAKLSYDLYYVKNRSIFLDILILLSTVRVILLQEGAR